MTRGFAAELGRHGIRVNSGHPGAVATPMGSGDMLSAVEHAYATNPKLANMGTTFVDPPYAKADQIAAVAVLVLGQARFITGEHLSIDGGAQHF